MAYLKQRKRLTGFSSQVGISLYNNDILFSKQADIPISWGANQSVLGEGHITPSSQSRYKGKKWKQKRNIVSFDMGGPVIITNHEYVVNPVFVETWNRPIGSGGLRQGIRGFYSYAPSLGIPSAITTPPSLNTSTLEAMGAKGWAKFKPTASHGSLGQALGELHDLPNLGKWLAYRNALKQAGRNTNWKTLARDTGHNYLNVQFGWVPLLSDIRDLIKNTLDMQKNLDQLIRDNGRPVRRRGLVAKTTSTTFLAEGGSNPSVPPLPSGCYDGGWTRGTATVTTTDYYFSARFRYYIDFQEAFNGSLKEANRMSRILLGAELSPYTLYQLMPWSWLIDWFTNFGAMINNLVNDASDNLTADYAYINGKATTNVYTTHTQKLNNSGKEDGEYRFTFEERSSVFRRIGASPYGFGITFTGLSAKQAAILAALGLTKVR